MELLSTLENALALFIEKRVQQELETRIAPFVDDRINLFLESTLQQDTVTRADLNNAINHHLQMYHEANTSYVTRDQMDATIKEELEDLWDGDFEDRVVRMIGTHVENEHDEDVIKDHVADAFDRQLGNLDNNTVFEKAVCTVVRDNMRFRVAVD